MHDPNALSSQIRNLTEILYVLRGMESEMHCAPGVTQTATCEKQICLCIKH